MGHTVAMKGAKGAKGQGGKGGGKGAAPAPTRPPPVGGGQTFEPQSDEFFDGSGIVAHLGTGGGTYAEYENPHEKGLIVVTLSSEHPFKGGGKPRDALGGLKNQAGPS